MKLIFLFSVFSNFKYLLTIVEANSRREKVSRSIQDNDGDWCILHHLLGCCLLAQARYGFQGVLKEKKVCEAIRCFFRYLTIHYATRMLLILYFLPLMCSFRDTWINLFF